jgi:hypothetical protein
MLLLKAFNATIARWKDRKYESGLQYHFGGNKNPPGNGGILLREAIRTYFLIAFFALSLTALILDLAESVTAEAVESIFFTAESLAAFIVVSAAALVAESELLAADPELLQAVIAPATSRIAISFFIRLILDLFARKTNANFETVKSFLIR